MIKDVITFEASAKEDILSFFDKSVDDEGLIVEKDNPSQRVITLEGEEISLKEFAGIKRGSEIFIKSDLISLMNLSDHI
ncbi:hypothetical protein BMS3Abin16_00925 [archaeon BMS3Abin16]|nr:hypothetical protein BMS3Abin16_00925 [archaeon BMS3Abin16]